MLASDVTIVCVIQGAPQIIGYRDLIPPGDRRAPQHQRDQMQLEAEPTLPAISKAQRIRDLDNLLGKMKEEILTHWFGWDSSPKNRWNPWLSSGTISRILSCAASNYPS